MRITAWGAPLLGFVLALAVHHAVGPDEPGELVRDAAHYDRLAWNLARGLGYRTTPDGPPDTVRTPGYPAFLAVIYAVFGHRLGPVWVAHAALHACSVALLDRLRRRLVVPPPSETLLAPWLFAAYPFALHAGSRVLTEALATVLVLVALDRLWSDYRSERVVQPALAGGLLGILALVRPGFVFLPALVAGFFAWRRRPARHALAIVATAALICSPWAVRTTTLAGRPVLLGAFGTGNNLHIAAWEFRRLDEGWPRTSGYQETPGYWASRRRAERAVAVPPGSPRYFAALDRALSREALRAIGEAPLLYLRACLLRVPKLWISQSLAGAPAWVGLGAALASIGVLGFGIWGLARTGLRNPGVQIILLPVVYLTCIHTVLHAEARYSIPVRPVVLLFGSVAVASLLRRAGAHPPASGAAPDCDPGPR